MINSFEENILLSSPKFVKQKEYWVEKLAHEISVTEIPGDIISTDITSTSTSVDDTARGTDSIVFNFSEELCAQLLKLSKQADLSLFILILTGIKTLIYRYARNQDIVISTPLYSAKVTGETLNNRLVIHDTVSGTDTFRQLLMKVKQSVLAAYENQDYPLDKLHLSTNSKGGTTDDGSLTRIACSLGTIHTQNHNTFIGPTGNSLHFAFTRDGKCLGGKMIYNTNRYSPEFARQLGGHFLRLMDHALQDVSTEISKLPLLSEAERNRLIFDFNQTASDFPKEKTLHQLFREQVEKTPEQIAVSGFSDREGSIRSLTYAQLDREANIVAARIRSLGTQRNNIVAIITDRSIEMITGLLGILKSGAGYLPITPTTPLKRILTVLKDCNATALLTTGHTLRNPLYAHLLVDQEASNIATSEITLTPDSHKSDSITLHDYISYMSKALLLDEPTDTGTTDSLPPVQNQSDDLAAVIYTSGSTGQPKGVMVEHRNIVNVVGWFGDRYNIQSGTPVVLFSDYTFDASMNQIFGTLLRGGSLYMPTKSLLSDIDGLRQYLNENCIYLVNFVPAFLKVLLGNGPKIESIKHVLSGGEKLTPQIKDILIQKGYKLHNQYGPTESTIDALVYQCTPGPVLLGSPITNAHCYIVDPHFNPVPIGVMGEIMVAGAGIVRGYLNNPQYTMEKFIQNPLVPDETIYQTGDIGCWLPDGNIRFAGRADHQVKVRGFRIELGEIETHLGTYPNIGEYVVTLRQSAKDENYLCAYFTSPETISSIELRDYLINRLPEYMVPAYFVQLESMPVTTGGKIDRKALPDPGIAAEVEYIAPRDEIEEKLARIWAGILGVPSNTIGIHIDFFKLGGHSLKATVMISMIHKEFDVKISLGDIFKTPTIEGIANFLKAVTWIETDKTNPQTSTQADTQANKETEEFIL